MTTTRRSISIKGTTYERLMLLADQENTTATGAAELILAEGLARRGVRDMTAREAESRRAKHALEPAILGYFEEIQRPCSVQELSGSLRRPTSSIRGAVTRLVYKDKLVRQAPDLYRVFVAPVAAEDTVLRGGGVHSL